MAKTSALHSELPTDQSSRQQQPTINWLQVPFETVPIEVQPTTLFDLMAPVHGIARALTDSPNATDRMQLYGLGVYQTPRLERVQAPIRAKIIAISEDGCHWQFALNKHLRMHLFVHVHSPLPRASWTLRAGDIVDAGTELMRISTSAMRQQPIVMTCVEQAAGQAIVRYAASAMIGNLSAAQDRIIRIYQPLER